ncbi:MAG: alpha-glucan family phosphorylase [Myxococcota bacterium]
MQPTAYFSAEIGFSSNVPTYSGGLGVLAGDHLKSAADEGLPLMGVTLLYRQGYFRQHIDREGWQSESYPSFQPEPLLDDLKERVEITLYGRRVQIAIWRTHVTGLKGHKVPILFLDTDLEENAPEDRGITSRLYGGDLELRLMQEAVLGFGGMKAVGKIYPDVRSVHLNEGHTAFAPLERMMSGIPLDEIKRTCHFTTHTPVPAGHDVFPYDMAYRALGSQLPENIRDLAGQDSLSMSVLALTLCGSANGVSKLHGEVSREMFPNHEIGHVTNGVHHNTWVSRPLGKVFDRETPGWRSDPELLRSATEIPDAALLDAHRIAKRDLLTYANDMTNLGFAESILTIGFARRAASYKRATLLFRDPERLARICGGRVQFLFAGKAHPRDEAGHRIIQAVVQAGLALGSSVRVGFLINYTMWTGHLLTSGVDVWLNNPLRPHEASGTSGMKAALNGVPNASVLDGWWAEGAKDNVNGWVIGDADNPNDDADADSLYRTLEERIISTYYDRRADWVRMMKESIATGAYFTGTRMIQEYRERYYG